MISVNSLELNWITSWLRKLVLLMTRTCFGTQSKVVLKTLVYLSLPTSTRLDWVEYLNFSQNYIIWSKNNKIWAGNEKSNLFTQGGPKLEHNFKFIEQEGIIMPVGLELVTSLRWDCRKIWKILKLQLSDHNEPFYLILRRWMQNST